MGYIPALLVFLFWPISAVVGQRVAKERGREPELWLFLCGLGGPIALALLRFALPPGSGKIPRRRAADRIIAGISLLFLLCLVCFGLLYSCFSWR